MTVPVMYPWQQPVWQLLVQSRARQSLPHALMISGLAGVGKKQFTEALSAWLLCQQPTAAGGCGQCKSCQLWLAGTHPDYRLLEAITDDKTGKTSKVIKVDQVRELVAFLSKSPQLNGYRVAVIEPADILNINAANSLLKTLEEPGTNTAIILLTDQPLALLPTIRSRCQHFAIPLPDRLQGKQWLSPQLKQAEQADLLLQLSENAPLAARELEQAAWFQNRQELAKTLVVVAGKKKSSLQAAQYWQKTLKPEELLLVLQLLLADALLVSFGQDSAIKNSDLLPIITQISASLTSARLLELHGVCVENQRLLAANIQPGLLMDNFWQAVPVMAV